MTRQRDIEQLLDIWFDDGPTDAADAAFDAFVTRVYRQRQRHAWRFLPWRSPTMSTPIKIVAVVAALLAVIVGGAVFLGGGGTPIPVPSPSPTPSSSPTAPPSRSAATSASAAFPAWYTDAEQARQAGGSGILPAGSQTTRQFIAGSTYSVPEGWVNDADNALQFFLFPNSSANQDEYALASQTTQDIIMTSSVANNLGVICDATGMFQGSTAAEIIDWVMANDAFSTTEPVPVTIGGLSGLQVDVQLSPDWTGRCQLSPTDPPTTNYADRRGRVIMLDRPADSTIGIWIGSHHSADHTAYLADAMSIIESMQFNLGPGASPSP